jgi:hypothetical protein
MKQSLGMLTASAWHREQLLEARRRLDQRNLSRLKARFIPITNSLITKTTSPYAPSVAVREPTATATLTPHLR